MSEELSVLPSNPSPLLNPVLFQHFMMVAEMMSKDITLPPHLKNNIGCCLRLVEMSYRVQQSPFAIADCTFFIGGKLGFEGKLIAALINAHPSINDSLRYSYEGDPKNTDEYFLTVSAIKKNETEPRTVKISLAQGIKDSSKMTKDGKLLPPNQRWIDDPQQMMSYYGSRVWARRHAPEVIMGLYTPEELNKGFDHAKDVTPPKFTHVIIENAPSFIKTDEEYTAEYQMLCNSILNASSLKDLGALIKRLSSFKGSQKLKDALQLSYSTRMTYLKGVEKEASVTLSPSSVTNSAPTEGVLYHD